MDTELTIGDEATATLRRWLFFGLLAALVLLVLYSALHPTVLRFHAISDVMQAAGGDTVPAGS